MQSSAREYQDNQKTRVCYEVSNLEVKDAGIREDSGRDKGTDRKAQK